MPLSQGFLSWDKTRWAEATWGRKALFHLTACSSLSRNDYRNSRKKPVGRG